MSATSVHLLVISYPQAGHTNPMLQFSKNLASRGILVTFVNFRFDHQRILKAESLIQNLGLSIRFESISDHLPPNVDVSDILYIYGHLHEVGASGMEELIHRLNATGPPVRCIVHDSFLPWVRHVCHKFNIQRSVFYTSSATVCAIYHHFNHEENWSYCGQDSKDVVVVPGLPELRVSDLSSTFFPPHLGLGLQHRSLCDVANFSGASSVMFNTFYELERQAIDFLRQANVPVFTVGPLIPSGFLEGGNPLDKEIGGSPWKEAAECIAWLDSKPPASVIYVSFGSIATIGSDQIRHIAVGLQKSGQNFIWSIRPEPGQRSVSENFPDGFVEEIKDRGLIIEWSPQVRVLSHPSVGGFMSHCGWNSTVEAVSQGVPMLTCAVWFDQPTNCKWIVDVWKTGVRLERTKKSNGDMVIAWEEVERGVRSVVCSEEGAELRKNALKWKESARKAMREDGDSYKDLHKFIVEVKKNM